MLIRALVLCLVVLGSAGALARGEPERPSFIPPAPPAPPGWDEDTQDYGRGVPYQIEDAYKDLVQRGDDEGARLTVMVYALRINDRGLEKVRDRIRAEGWDARFLGLYDATAAQVRVLLAGDPRRIYDLAMDYGRRAGLSGNPYHWNKAETKLATAARKLFMEAVGQGVPEAEYEYAQAHLVSPDSAEVRTGIQALKTAAEGGHHRALLELITRYQEGRDVPRDLGSEYFWLLRGKSAGLAVGERLSEVERILPPDVRERIRNRTTAPYP